jgi:hypothetical protein
VRVPLALAIALGSLAALEAFEALALAIPLEALADGAVFERPHPTGPQVTVRVAQVAS